ncbi:proline/glycine betaine transporter ProP [Streptomyces alfalfae]|uniref:MFS transporter n=1 Tax=Streptomyces alfalfae TaxID=1642299 RepID=A0ABN4VGS8_9ACTN|nr:glycine betaine/L-proline transporter ProP [Streptomyces alfalfae]AYA15984.1 proline/glycine betaine transporter ProP [Streptomyces fradiae]APY85628.1 MFS transporter [Streptomyces alfalfae]QUI34645.1 glycine betaine/L-proline transporter ProP [Streptomyces alfalfae]RXX39457.1 proline/glycine betaine transporter ProP [Streptomyces alfalfae]RZM83752.1 proline/glycine betaine transporter ProP [Streptomyces alfalfae]
MSAPEAPDETPATPAPEAVARHRALFRAIQRRRNPRLRQSDITVTEEAQVQRAVKATALGNAMEWYDFGVYAYLAVIIGKEFFPSGNDTAQTLSSLATFAAAFLVRPIGGMFFGPLGDRVGRKKILALTMIMMSTATLAIGLIPSYASIGFWAPALLVLCRMVQGFSTGGEYGGAATFIAEYAPDKRRGFWGSFLEFGTLIGYTVAAVLVTVLTMLLSDDAMQAWGWRIPFLVAAPLGLIGLYLRLKLDESPAFQKMEEAGDGPAAERQKKSFAESFVGQWRAMLLCIALVAAFNVTDYMLLSYMPTYLTERGFGETGGLMSIVIVMLILMALINSVGRLSDRVGRKPVLMAGSVGFFVLALPAFLLIKQGGTVPVFAGLLILGLALVCYLGAMSSSLPALFPTDVRYGSLSIGFNISVSLFGGTTPLVVAALIGATGNDLMPAFYTMLAGLVGIIAVAAMKETARKPLQGSPPSVATPEEARELVEAQR